MLSEYYTNAYEKFFPLSKYESIKKFCSEWLHLTYWNKNCINPTAHSYIYNIQERIEGLILISVARSFSLKTWWTDFFFFLCWIFLDLLIYVLPNSVLHFVESPFVTGSLLLVLITSHRLPWWFSGKESDCQSWRLGLDSWVWKIPWIGRWQPAPVFLPGKSHGQRSLVDFSPQDHKRVWQDLATEEQ